MNSISPLHASILPSAERPPVAPTAITSEPRDGFSEAAPASFDATQMMRTLRELRRVEKDGKYYTLQSSALAPDGATYFGYGQWGGPGYVSRVGADGVIQWEAALESVKCVSVDDQGVLHAIGEKGEVRLDARGAELGRTEFAGRAEKAWVDPRDGRVVYMADRKLQTADGKPLPGSLADLSVTEFAPAEDGRSLRIRTADRWLELTASMITAERSVPPNGQDGKVYFSVDHVAPLPEGATLVEMRRTIELRSPHRFLTRGMGGGFGPMEPDPGEYITDVTFRKLDASGQKIWETTNVADSARFTVTADGTPYVAMPPVYQKPAAISRLDDKGAFVPFAQVEGTISGISAEGNDLLVKHEGGIARVSSDGTVVDVKIPQGWSAQRFLPGGKVLVYNPMGSQAALFNPADQSVTPVTDVTSDHSSGRTGELERMASKMPPADPGKGLQVEPQWIVVDGIRVPRNPQR